MGNAGAHQRRPSARKKEERTAVVSAFLAAGTAGNINTGALAQGVAESGRGRARAMKAAMSFRVTWRRCRERNDGLRST